MPHPAGPNPDPVPEPRQLLGQAELARRQALLRVPGGSRLPPADDRPTPEPAGHPPEPSPAR